MKPWNICQEFAKIAQMAPHSIETILLPPQWPLAFSNFVTWCLMWDPRNRPTSAQAMSHEYFTDAVDPLRPKSSTTRLLGRKHSNIESKANGESTDRPSLASKSSWFRKSIVAKENMGTVTQHNFKAQSESPRGPPVHSHLVHANTSSNIPTMTTTTTATTIKPRPFASKRATWTNGLTPSIGAPMPILPSIRPISPFSDTVTAQAHSRLAGSTTGQTPNSNPVVDNKSSKKIGRQLSVASHGNHYADFHRQEAERALNGNRDSMSPNGYQKESFFSHLRKRARRLSGRPQAPLSPNSDDVEANAGCGPWQSNRSSMVIDSSAMEVAMKKNVAEVDKSSQNPRYGVEASPPLNASQSQKGNNVPVSYSVSPAFNPHQALPQGQASRTLDVSNATSAGAGPISSRTRRALHMSTQPAQMYETPDEEDELLHEALNSSHRLPKSMNHRKADDAGCHNTVVIKEKIRKPLQQSVNNELASNPYPTPSPSAKRNGVLFSQNLMEEPITPLNISKGRSKEDIHPKWPTPPYEENEWAASAAASIFAAGSVYE